MFESSISLFGLFVSFLAKSNSFSYALVLTSSSSNEEKYFVLPGSPCLDALPLN